MLATNYLPPAIVSSYQAEQNTSESSFLSQNYLSYYTDQAEFATDKLGNPYIYYAMNIDRVFKVCLDDAIVRFYRNYEGVICDENKYSVFFNQIKLLEIIPRLSFHPNGVKARFIFKNKEFAVEYRLERPDFILVSAFIDDELHIKDGGPSNLGAVLASF
jgi:hypothetical protein